MPTNYRSSGVATSTESVPLLEIACIGLETPARVAASGLVIQAETGLRSRSLAPRFQAELDTLAGCLYRLGRAPERDGVVSAYDLLSAGARAAFPPTKLEFAGPERAKLERVLADLLAASPERRLLVTSDWQYGPEWAHRFGPLTLAEFWALHASGHLYLNTAYEVAAGP
jgi:hypothetical protein